MEHQAPCPSCGYCPCCGRRPQGAWPVVPSPYWPYGTWPYQQPYITFTSGGDVPSPNVQLAASN